MVNKTAINYIFSTSSAGAVFGCAAPLYRLASSIIEVAMINRC